MRIHDRDIKGAIRRLLGGDTADRAVDAVGQRCIDPQGAIGEGHIVAANGLGEEVAGAIKQRRVQLILFEVRPERRGQLEARDALAGIRAPALECLPARACSIGPATERSRVGAGAGSSTPTPAANDGIASGGGGCGQRSHVAAGVLDPARAAGAAADAEMPAGAGALEMRIDLGWPGVADDQRLQQEDIAQLDRLGCRSGRRTRRGPSRGRPSPAASPGPAAGARAAPSAW